ncbi:hypothetical protein NDU88_005208 [Pleurodeles waltl]|uniref:Uncharacterized protein n=1 Tax=Pleurodeles waltl TaxID=8319 RepID=A0AAV7RNF8_PLEWA|nr:hypothetical protein NDU88_005208 [Pleurodeles waltl]
MRNSIALHQPTNLSCFIDVPVESGVEEMHPVQLDLTRQVAALMGRMGELESCAEDVEGCSRRNKIRIIGLPEGTGGGGLVSYLENWMRIESAPTHLTPFFTLEHAHRFPTKPLAPVRRPRPVVAKLLHFQDQDVLMERA